MKKYLVGISGCLTLAFLVPPGAFRFKGGNVPLVANMVAYWNLDELSGTRAKTVGTCTSCDLTAVNAPNSAGGVGRFSLLPEATKYLQVADNASLSITDETFGTCAWVRVSAVTTEEIVSKWTASAAPGYRLLISTSDWQFWTGGVGGFNVSPNSAATVGRHFICGWHNVTDSKMYIQQDNGAEAGAARGRAPVDSNELFTVGAKTGGTFGLNGSLGPVMFWKGGFPDTTARTALYNSGLGYPCASLPTASRTNLIACWDLAEASGTRAESGIGSCGATCDLTAVNAPGRTAGLIQSSLGMSAYAVSGSSQALNLADNADISVGDEDFTVACWVNPSVLGTKVILDKTDEYRLGTNATNKPYAKTGTTDTAAVADAAVAGVWIYIAGGHDAVANNTWVSVNGAARVTVAETAAPADTANALRIFSTTGGTGYWDGAVDACTLWKRNVPDASLLALYNSGAGVEYPWSAIASLFQPSVQWADLPIPTRQRIVYAKTGVVVPEFMFPTRKVSIR